MEAIDKINAILKQKGLSGAELERMIGVSNSVYSQWNTGSTKPSNKSLAKVASALDVDISEILPDASKRQKKSATITGDGKAEILSIFSELNPSRQAKLLELARLYLADQRKNEEIQ